jgi:hypothetical protein
LRPADQPGRVEPSVEDALDRIEREHPLDPRRLVQPRRLHVRRPARSDSVGDSIGAKTRATRATRASCRGRCRAAGRNFDRRSARSRSA